LAPLALDTFTVADHSPPHAKLADLLEVDAPDSARRVDMTVAALQGLEVTNVSSKTGVVQLAVGTRWQSLSLAIVQRLVSSVNDFNLRTRQGQAGDERRFTENRLAEAKTTLRAAEDRLQAFLQGNRQFASPDLKFQQDRLEREVTLDQQIVG